MQCTGGGGPDGDYVIELTALNGTGFKGACNFADANTGEIAVSGLNLETQVWRHRGGCGIAGADRGDDGCTAAVHHRAHAAGGDSAFDSRDQSGL